MSPACRKASAAFLATCCWSFCTVLERSPSCCEASAAARAASCSSTFSTRSRTCRLLPSSRWSCRRSCCTWPTFWASLRTSSFANTRASFWAPPSLRTSASLPSKASARLAATSTARSRSTLSLSSLAASRASFWCAPSQSCRACCWPRARPRCRSQRPACDSRSSARPEPRRSARPVARETCVRSSPTSEAARSCSRALLSSSTLAFVASTRPPTSPRPSLAACPSASRAASLLLRLTSSGGSLLRSSRSRLSLAR
mmetsp:Transcript_81407/g.230609  ORF Transcript_81407/g.230609 Transcript_81407/m.230609 type:complete len:257 (+) Transcript_81407:503-1273(+)